jgi:N-acetylglutamate synthase-like GNAT family acetyltransferase
MQAASAHAPFDWRRATGDDLFTLAALYRDAALRLGPLVYTPAQARAWASFANDESGFRDYVLDTDTWVAERPGDGRMLGFCGGRTRDGMCELPSLYVTPARTRQGIGAEMLRRTLERAGTAGATRFAAWVTPFSRPVFLAAGFALTQTVSAPFAGTLFERYRVERG